MPEIFYVAMDLGNDAFGHQPERAATADDMRPEVVRILKDLTRRIEEGGPLQYDGAMTLIDSNGNRVGYAGVVDDKHVAFHVYSALEALADGKG
jgi:hypothetical protein